MNKYNSLIKNTFLYAIGPLLNRLLSIILIPYYTFHFSTSELGYYDLIITSGSLVIAVSTLKIADALYRWLIDCEADKNKKVSAISNSFFIIIISCVVVGATFALLESNFIKYPNLVYAYISSTILLSYLQQMLRGLGYLKIYCLLAFINCFFLVLFHFLF